MSSKLLKLLEVEAQYSNVFHFSITYFNIYYNEKYPSSLSFQEKIISNKDWFQ